MVTSDDIIPNSKTPHYDVNELNNHNALNIKRHVNNPDGDLNKINSIKTIDNEHEKSPIGHVDKEIVAHYSKDNKVNNTEGVKFVGLEDDNDSVGSYDSDDDKLPPIPDGGWGWVVVVAAFLVSACADGLAFSFGLLHEEFTNYFDTTQSKSSLIGSLFIATPLLAGPIMSALVDRYGCRSMTMLAGVMSTIGFLLASISNSIEMLCLTFGFLSGLAMGILYVTAVVSVAFWFDRRRNFAVSLASCGMGFGTLIFSPMTSYFLEVFDWRNTIVLLAGTLLNMCVCGALMRDPDWLKIKQKRQRKLSRSRRSSSAGSISNRSVGADSEIFNADELKALLKSGKSPEYILNALAATIAEAEQLDETTKMNINQTVKRMHSVLHIPTFIQQNEKVPQEVIEKLLSNKNMYNIILKNYPSLLSVRSHSEAQLYKNEENQHVVEPTEVKVSVKVKKPRTTSTSNKEETLSDDGKNTNHDAELGVIAKTQLHKSDSEKTKTNRSRTERQTSHRKDWISRQISTDYHYLRGMPLYKNTIMHRGAMMTIPRYKLRVSSLPNIYKNSNWSLTTASDYDLPWYKSCWQICKNTFDFRMFTEFHFLMFNLASLIFSVWFIVPYFFLQSFMTANHMDGGPTMISIIGIASSVGIVALGWVGDQPWMNVIKAYAICLMICGISVGIYPTIITNFWGLAATSTLFGLSFASSYSYTPTILMELMPLDKFTVAYGLILLSQGIGHLIGPPIGGMLYDLTNAWDLTFYMGGIWLFISGLCVGVIGFTYDKRMCGTEPLLKETELSEKYEKNAPDDDSENSDETVNLNRNVY